MLMDILVFLAFLLLAFLIVFLALVIRREDD